MNLFVPVYNLVLAREVHREALDGIGHVIEALVVTDARLHQAPEAPEHMRRLRERML